MYHLKRIKVHKYYRRVIFSCSLIFVFSFNAISSDDYLSLLESEVEVTNLDEKDGSQC